MVQMFFDGFAIDNLKSFEKLWKINWLAIKINHLAHIMGQVPYRPPEKKFTKVPRRL